MPIEPGGLEITPAGEDFRRMMCVRRRYGDEETYKVLRYQHWEVSSCKEKGVPKKIRRHEGVEI